MKTVTIPLGLAQRLADTDWGAEVPDNHVPLLALEPPFAGSALATFTVGDLRQLGRIVEQAEREASHDDQ